MRMSLSNVINELYPKSVTNVDAFLALLDPFLEHSTGAAGYYLDKEQTKDAEDISAYLSSFTLLDGGDLSGDHRLAKLYAAVGNLSGTDVNYSCNPNCRTYLCFKFKPTYYRRDGKTRTRVMLQAEFMLAVYCSDEDKSGELMIFDSNNLSRMEQSEFDKVRHNLLYLGEPIEYKAWHDYMLDNLKVLNEELTTLF